MLQTEYEVIEGGSTPFIRINEGIFAGVVIQYGSVKFEENARKDCLKLIFDLSIISGDKKLKSSPDFVNYAGSILEDLIRASIMSRSLIFAGGTDE